MKFALPTPLLDLFRRGEVARDMRLLAAQGALALRACEQLALLALLADDPDPDVRQVARNTVDGPQRAVLAGYLARPEIPSEVRTFFLARGVEPASGAEPTEEGPLFDDLLPAPGQPSPTHTAGGPRLPAAVSSLPVVERLKLALRGSREQRAALIRDPNKMVAVSVLSSPKLSEPEVEGFARTANVSEEVLRIIGTTRGWVRNYAICAALTRNAKTPLAVSLGLLARLNERDVKAIANDRNIPEPLRLAARKFVTAGESRRR